MSNVYTSARMTVTPNEKPHTVTTVTISVCLSSCHQHHVIHTTATACRSVPTHCVALAQKSTRIVRKCWQGHQSRGSPLRVAKTAKFPFHESQKSTNSVKPESIGQTGYDTRLAGRWTGTYFRKGNFKEEDLLNASIILNDTSIAQKECATQYPCSSG